MELFATTTPGPPAKTRQRFRWGGATPPAGMRGSGAHGAIYVSNCSIAPATGLGKLCPPAARWSGSGNGGGLAATVICVAAQWRDLERGAPEIARLGMARLTASRVALLGTVRRDGSPRISPVEPYFVAGRLLVGAMTWSTKAADLRRDPRYVLHSTVTGPDSGEEEVKLYGSAAEAGEGLRGQAAQAWWQAWAAAKAAVFCLQIERAVAIEWDLGHGLMVVHRWSPGSGYRKASRSYP